MVDVSNASSEISTDNREEPISMEGCLDNDFMVSDETDLAETESLARLCWEHLSQLGDGKIYQESEIIIKTPRMHNRTASKQVGIRVTQLKTEVECKPNQDKIEFGTDHAAAQACEDKLKFIAKDQGWSLYTQSRLRTFWGTPAAARYSLERKPIHNAEDEMTPG
jgi:hypothetical protein